MSYTPSLDDIENQPAQSEGYEPSIADIPRESLLQKAGNAAGTFNNWVEASRLPAAAGGLLQGTGDLGASLGNLLLKPINKEMGTNLNIPHPDLGKYVPNDLLSKAAYGGGEVGSLLTPLGLGGVAGKINELGGLAKNINKIPWIGKLLSSTLGGAATGYSLGENAEGGRGVGTAAGAAFGPSAAIATKLGIPGAIKALFDKVVPKDLANVIQGRHDILSRIASTMFNRVRDEAANRGINNIPMDKALVHKAYRFMPKTDASKALIENAKKGDYDAIRDLQSDLRERAEGYKGSDLQAEKNKGDEAFELRDKINGQVTDHFNATGNRDLAQTLTDAMSHYRNLKDIYFGHNVIARMVQKGLRKVPKNIASVLSEDSDPMRAIMQAHPELEDIMSRLQNKQEAAKMLKFAAVPLVAGTAGGIGSHYAEKLIHNRLGQ